jgi:ABC-2 type transport system permease protein
MLRDRVTPILRHNVALLRADPAPIVVTTLMPIVLMAFLQGMGRAVLQSDGYGDATGAEHVVPGMAVLFAFFGVTFVGMSFYTEHGWATWQRLRASQARPLEILLGKMLPSAAVIAVQTLVLFSAGWLLFGLPWPASPLALALMMLTSTVFLTCLSMLAVAVFRTINQLSAAANVGAMVLCGIGGALAPLSVMPAWAQAVAPVSPAYWALEGYRRVVLEDAGASQILVPATVLVALAALAAVAAARRFRFDDEKVWA